MDIKIGVIGFGKMGMLQGALANSIEGMQLTAIAEKSRFVRWGFKAVKKGVRIYSDYQKMLDSDTVDAVIITTPTSSHYEITEYALKKNISVFIEKPLAGNYDDAKRLDMLLKETSCVSMVGFCYRFSPSYSEGKKLIDSGILGEIKSIKTVIFSNDVTSAHKGWRFNPQLSGGGVLMDFGIHMVDMLIWYFGKVHSVISSQSSMFSQDVEDSFRSKIRFSQGNEADFETSWSNPDYRKPYAKIEIQGERAKLTITDQTLGIITDNGIKQLTAPDLYTGSYVDIGGIGFSKQMQAFYESIRNRTESDLGISGACYVHKVIEAMYFSAKANKRVDL